MKKILSKIVKGLLTIVTLVLLLIYSVIYLAVASVLYVYGVMLSNYATPPIKRLTSNLARFNAFIRRTSKDK